VYAAEEFSSEEADVLRRYFTNLDQPVFALVNLPEVVKGALFARYSRSHKSLRRLFLDEFVTELDITGDATIDATIGLHRAEELYEKVFVEYGDDSVAQLGGVHLACEQASNLLTKVLEWGRLMSYLEQSTRYIAYDSRLDGRYRYFRDPGVLASPLGTRYVGDLDRLFDTYAELVPLMQEFFRAAVPQEPGDSDFVYRQALRARAFDAVRGVLPGASLSNVGIYGTGQGYEQLLLRMRANPLPEARGYADLMLTELRKVIPSFLKRVDLPERGQAWSDYLEGRQDAMATIAGRLLPSDLVADEAPPVTLTAFDPDAEVHLVTAMLYPHSHLPERQIEARVRGMSASERIDVVEAYVGERANRRHKPGRSARTARLPLRRPRRLRSVPRPPAPSDAHGRVADAQPTARLHPPRGGRCRRSGLALRRGDGAVRRPARRPPRAVPRPGALRGLAGVPGALRAAAQRP